MYGFSTAHIQQETLKSTTFNRQGHWYLLPGGLKVMVVWWYLYDTLYYKYAKKLNRQILVWDISANIKNYSKITLKTVTNNETIT